MNTNLEMLNAAVIELQAALLSEVQNLADAENDFNEAVACASPDDELIDCQSYVEQRGFAVKRAEARLRAAEGELLAFQAKTKADTGKAHAEAAKADAERICELLVEFDAQCKKLSEITQKIYGITPKCGKARDSS